MKYTLQKVKLLLYCEMYVPFGVWCEEVWITHVRFVCVAGLSYAAVHYYKKVLEMPPVVEDEQVSVINLLKYISPWSNITFLLLCKV